MVMFPFFEDIENKTFLIVGGGRVAAGKVSRLLQFTGQIVVIAPETDIEGVTVHRRGFEKSDLELGDYIIAATDDRTLNRQIGELCRERGKPVNVADDPALCSFAFPAVVRRGDLTIGISTGGSSPAYAQMLRQEIEKQLPDHIDLVLDSMQRLRQYLPAVCHSQAERRRLLHEALILMLESPDLTEYGPDRLTDLIRASEP